MGEERRGEMEKLELYSGTSDTYMYMYMYNHTMHNVRNYKGCFLYWNL